MKTYFPSKRDLSLGIIIYLPIVILLAFCSAQQAWRAVIMMVPLTLFVFWLWFGTGYTVTDTDLKIKCGPIRTTILLDAISKIEKSTNPASSPALSFKRLEIQYGKFNKKVLISPKERESFLELLRNSCPNVNIKV